MIQQNKKGFSLVEVMILFTVLAVVLAAALPAVTRRSHPIPNKINHGVYRCINVDGVLRQELYTGTQQVAVERVNRCTFRVPEAALYKVDLYSAGAGGTLGAVVTAQLDDTRSATFSAGGDYSTVQMPEDFENPPFERRVQTALPASLSSSDIMHFFQNERVIRSHGTGNAGNGGNASFSSYRSPKNSRCAGMIESTEAQHRRHIEDTEAYNDKSEKYSDYLRQRDKQIDDNGKLSGEYEKLEKDAKGKKDLKSEYANLIEAFEKVISDITKFNGSGSQYGKLREDLTIHVDQGVGLEINLAAYWNVVDPAVMYAKAPKKANAMIDQADSLRKKQYLSDQDDVKKCVAQKREDYIKEKIASARTKYIKDNVDETGKTAEQILAEKQSAGSTFDSDYDRIQQISTTAGNDFDQAEKQSNPPACTQCQDDLGITLSDYNDDTTKAKNPYRIYDYMNNSLVNKEGVNNCDYQKGYTSKYQSAERLTAYLRNNSTCVTDSDRAEELYYSSGSIDGVRVNVNTRDYGYALTGDGIVGLYKRAELLKDQATKKWKELDDEETKQGKSFEEQEEEAKARKEAYDKKKDTAVKERTAEEERLTEIAKESEALWRDLLAGDFISILDNNYGFTDASVFDTEGNTLRQMEQYCREVYSNNGEFSDQVIQGTASDSQSGGLGGQGRRLRLTYPIRFSREATLEQQISYLQDVSRNVRVQFCAAADANGNATDCANNDITMDLTGTNKTNKIYESDKDNLRTDFRLENIRRIFMTGRGQDLAAKSRPFVAYNIPIIQNGRVLPGRPLTLVSILPTGGEQANMWVNETQNGTYQDVVIPADMTNPSDIAARIFSTNYAYRVETTDSENGDPVVFLPNITQVFDQTLGTTFTLDGDLQGPANATINNPLSQEPRVTLNANLWTKTYTLGLDGNGGRNVSFMVANLGSRCQFDVPNPGEIFVWGSGQSIRTLEEALTLRMTCSNRDGNVVLERELRGGTYRPQIVRLEGARFHWYRNMGAQTFEHQHTTPEQWRPSSIWARAYNDWMGGFNAYDLNAFRVGAPGHGTVMTDSCTAPQGTLTLTGQRLISISDGDSIPQDYTTPIVYNFDGMQDGVECYGHREGDEEQVRFEVEEGDRFFDIEAEEGGGGAVVITW